MILTNENLEARFDEASGALVHLSRPGAANLLQTSGCRCEEGDVLVSEVPEEEQYHPFRVASVTASDDAVESVLKSGAVEVTRRYVLGPDDALLSIRHEVRGTGAMEEIRHPGFPRMIFADDFVDAFEDTEDLFFDGAELGGGQELPCWRVFFREGHGDGLLLATRSKREMGRFQIYARGFDLKPHILTAYDTNYILAYSPMAAGKGQANPARFEIGPWQAGGTTGC